MRIPALNYFRGVKMSPLPPIFLLADTDNWPLIHGTRSSNFVLLDCCLQSLIPTVRLDPTVTANCGLSGQISHEMFLSFGCLPFVSINYFSIKNGICRFASTVALA